MNKLLLLILLVGGSYWAYQRHTASSGNRLSFPTTVAWRHTSSGPAPFVETVAVHGDRWRIELAGSRKTIVVVFDGHALASTNAKVTAREWDPRTHMQQVYAGLPSTAGIPIERVGTTDCWHFHVSRGAIDADVWVDTKTRFLRKVSGRFEGSDLNETYDLLPLDVNAEAKRLFDTKNLRMLLSQ